jgi:hypothetical protein
MSDATQTVWAVRYGNYEPSEVLALYDNEQAAREHADAGEMLEVVPMGVLSEYQPEAE